MTLDASSTTALGPISWQREPRLLPFLPMLYVAWADGDLTDSELRDLRATIGDLDGLDPEERGALQSWLDPDNPPDANALQALLSALREAADDLGAPQRRSLVGLGIEMARREELAEGWPGDAERDALDTLADAIGLTGSEGLDVMLPTAQYRHTASKSAQESAPTFDIDTLSKLLDAPYADVRAQVRETLNSPFFRHVSEYDKTAYRDQVLRWCQELSRRGFGDLAYPGVTTQATSNMGEFIAVFETLGFFDLSLVVKYGVQYGLFGGSIYFLGTEKHHARWLKGAASLEIPGCFAMTERGHGSNVRDLETVATYQPETQTFDIHSPTPTAGKEWIGNAACHGRLATVFAQLVVNGEGHGVHALVVPIRDEHGHIMPGVTIEDCGHKMGLNGVDNGRIWFDHVTVPRDNLLNRFADVTEDGAYTSSIASPTRRFFTMLSTLVAGRVSVASAALSAAKTGLTIAVRYSARRRQFGPSDKPEIAILNYRTHQRRLMPLLAKAYALDFALKRLVQRYLNRSEEDEREIEAMAAALKAYSTWNTTETLQICREACGGQGYLSANIIPQLKNDTDVFTTFEGDNTVLLQLVAKSLLTAWRQQFMESRVFGVLKHLARRASTAITELNPIITRQADPDHLKDADWQRDVFQARLDSLTNSAAMRLKRRIDSGMDPFDAFNDCQIHLIDLAQAYTDHLILDIFIENVRAIQDPDLRRALDLLRQLFGLWTLERDIGWFLENGYMEPVKAAAVRTTVADLCADVRSQALPLVEAFNIPESCLSAPIARPIPLGEG